MKVAVTATWATDGEIETFPGLTYYSPTHQLALTRKSDTPGRAYHIVDDDMEPMEMQLFSLYGVEIGMENTSSLVCSSQPILKSLKCEPDSSVLTEEQQLELQSILDDFSDIFSKGPSLAEYRTSIKPFTKSILRKVLSLS